MFPMCANINLFFIFRKFLAIQMRTRIIKQTQTLYKNILLNGFEQNLLRNKNKTERRKLLFYLSFVQDWNLILRAKISSSFHYQT